MTARRSRGGGGSNGNLLQHSGLFLLQVHLLCSFFALKCPCKHDNGFNMTQFWFSRGADTRTVLVVFEAPSSSRPAITI